MADKKYLIDNAELMAEWNRDKNTDLDPNTITISSAKKAWWKCSKGHEWQAIIENRSKGSGCPYCANQKVLKGYNDLNTVNPTLASEWHYKKNGYLKPEYFTVGSGKKVWWICCKGHEWEATINSRNRGNGCPICSSGLKTSFPEYALVFYLKKHGVDTIHSFTENGYELDIYIPSKSIAIEYDGYYWHKNKTQQDLEKNLKCKKDGITLYRIREGLAPLNDSSLDFVVQSTQKDLFLVLEKVLQEILGTSIVVDLERDAIDIENLREFTEKESSLLFSNPEIANEWNYEKNGSLNPKQFTVSSGKKVWWICSKGHEWQAIIASRNGGRGCPYCVNKKVLKGYNDLLTVNPSLASEWDYDKNGDLAPEHFTVGSNKKVWWRCSKGHEWQATISSRNSGRGCPYCVNQKIVRGYNDLQTVNPALSNEWNYDKNGDLTPKHFTVGSGKKVWWRCSKGHEWQAIIASRNKGIGCPYCAGKKVLKGYNDLQTVNPALSNEWNYDKNGDLTPEHFTVGSDKKVWWRCSKGHEWQAAISSRNGGRGCPYCVNQKIVRGYNDLQTVNPALSNEWNYDKNGDLKPWHFASKSNKKVWWRCSNGHEWQATVAKRSIGQGCPICRKNKKKQ